VKSPPAIDGFQLAKNVIKHLRLSLRKLKLVDGNNFENLALWHGRINGCFAEAGVKQGFIIEVNKEFRRKWHSDFLNRYVALYGHRGLGKWKDTSTEIDVIWLNPCDCSAIAMCEYENEGEFNIIADNIIKFHALASSTEEDCKPLLCIVSFFCEEQDSVGCHRLTDELENLIKKEITAEKVSFKNKTFNFPPMSSWWLLIPFYGTKHNVRWRYLIENPNGRREEENEFSLNPMSSKMK